MRRRSQKKMTLVANDEFWHSPVLEMEDASSSDATSMAPASSTVSTSVSGGDKGELLEVLLLPAAHEQLLASDPVLVEDLKGYDHTKDVFGEDRDGYASDKSSCGPRRRASWLFSNPILPGLIPPGLVRVPSGASLESDECSYSESDDESSLAESSSKRPRRGVSFDTTVKVQPIPHSDTLTPAQRKKMYTTTWEVRENKIRNKKEYRYDGYNWRNVTEEWEMGVDMATGELVHPAHEFSKW